MKIVIVGGVAGGMSAATRLSRLAPEADIVVFERGPEVSYANCGLPYHIGGVISGREELILQTPQRLRARFGLHVRVHCKVTGIDRDARTVTVHDTANDTEYAERYDALILSPGAAPVVPNLPGIERALTLRTVADADRIIRELDAGRPITTAVIVGGGFIGLEVAENLHRCGLHVAIVEATDQVLAPLDPELAELVHAELLRNHIRLALGTSLAKVLPDAVELADGQLLPADLVILAIGVRPDTALAKTAGLAIGPHGGISVDAAMRTSDPHIYAIGDAVEKPDYLDGEPVLMPLANTANRQGRLVADTICGRPVHLRERLGTAIVAVFETTVAVTGWNEKRLRAAGLPHQAIHTHPTDHAGYYPAASPMALKLLFDPATGAILGAQGVGGSGVDKRIDIIATAMRSGLPANELADLELGYAPQYGSAKDPINILGYIAENLRTNTTRTVQWHQLANLQRTGATLIDVRTPGEHAAGHIPGSINIPVDELREHLTDLPAGPLVVYCGVGLRAHVAVMLLAGTGHDCVNLDGGYQTWYPANQHTCRQATDADVLAASPLRHEHPDTAVPLSASASDQPGLSS